MSPIISGHSPLWLPNCTMVRGPPPHPHGHRSLPGARLDLTAAVILSKMPRNTSTSSLMVNMVSRHWVAWAGSRRGTATPGAICGRVSSSWVAAWTQWAISREGWDCWRLTSRRCCNAGSRLGRGFCVFLHFTPVWCPLALGLRHRQRRLEFRCKEKLWQGKG